MEKDEADLLDQKANEIIASKKLVVTSRGPIWFTAATMEDKLVSKSIYDTRLVELKSQGILSADDILDMYVSQQLWSDDKTKHLELLPDMIQETTERIDSETKNRARKKKLMAWRAKLEAQYAELLESRNTRLANCAEYLAHDETYLYLIWSNTTKFNGKRYYKKFKDIQAETDIAWIEELIGLFMQHMKDLPEKDIRAVARGGKWRIRWNSFQNSSTELFGRTSQNLSNDQFMLVYWSQVYDSVYESMERPPEDVIMNDEALDQWLLTQQEERKRDVGQRYHGKGIQKNSKIENANEVMKVVTGEFDADGVWREYTDEERWEKIEKIRNLNSPIARRIKSNEEKKLKDTPFQFHQEHEIRKNKDHREIMGGNVTVKRSK